MDRRWKGTGLTKTACEEERAERLETNFCGTDTKSTETGGRKHGKNKMAPRKGGTRRERKTRGFSCVRKIINGVREY